MSDGFFFDEQLYPEDDIMDAAEALGISPEEVMLMMQNGGSMPSASAGDPYSILDMGQTYNPSQGYPNKQVSDQVWDLIQPTPDYLVAQQFNAMTPNREDFSLDTFFAADPMLRGPLAQALAQNEGDTLAAYDYLQSPDMQEDMRQQIGRTEWDQLRAQGDLRSIGAIGGEELDDAAMHYYNRGLEGLLAEGAPTTQRMAQTYDAVAQRMDGRPYSGAGTDIMGDSGGQDPMADLAGEGINLDATREGTAFGEGLMDMGAADPGEDRFEMRNGKRLAVIGGRYYDIPDTMERSGGRVNSEYQRALQSVVSRRRHRMDDIEGRGRSTEDRTIGEARKNLRPGRPDPTSNGPSEWLANKLRNLI